MRIAINGLGRMGRLFLRAAVDGGLHVAAANEPRGDGATIALAVEFDSVQGRWHRAVQSAPGRLRVGDHDLLLLQESAWERIDWRQLGVDLVVECSGRAKRADQLQPLLDRGAGRILVSRPVSGVPNLVYGVNHQTCDFAREPIVTAASCTTNCLAPLVRVLHDTIGIERGLVTTIHDPTNTQSVVDRVDADPRRGRAALTSLIPTTTNSATAVTLIVPELAGRLDSIAVRAPVLNASLTDCTFELRRQTTTDEIQHHLQAAATVGPLAGILGFETRPLVSADFARDPRSAIVDAGCTRVVDGRLAKVMAWYDNEWGYVNRMVDLARCCVPIRR
jgi:glyceraldehyde 3-phosphate dehydrogenase